MVAVEPVIAHPPISSPSSRIHLPRRVAGEFALVGPPLSHIPCGGAAYFDCGRPCFGHRAGCPARHACAASARARTLQKDACHRIALHYLISAGVGSYFAIQGLCACIRSHRSLLFAGPGALRTPEAFVSAAPVGPQCRPVLRPRALQDSTWGQGNEQIGPNRARSLAGI